MLEVGGGTATLAPGELYWAHFYTYWVDTTGSEGITLPWSWNLLDMLFFVIKSLIRFLIFDFISLGMFCQLIIISHPLKDTEGQENEYQFRCSGRLQQSLGLRWCRGDLSTCGGQLHSQTGSWRRACKSGLSGHLINSSLTSDYKTCLLRRVEEVP